MELGLKGKIALVTGSSRGIGRGVALALAAEGCDVMLTGRDQKALEEVAAAIRKQGRRAAIAVIDLRVADGPAKLIEQTKRELGGLDIVINNAGATKRGDFMALTDADWEDGYALKFFAHVRLARAAWPLLMERHGSLISIGGTGGRKPTEEFTIGSSVNAAVAAFSKCLADRGKHDGVQVNCIHPSMVETDRLWRRIKAEMDRTGSAGTKGPRGNVPWLRHHPVRQGRGRRRSHHLPRLVTRHLDARRDHRSRRRRDTDTVTNILLTPARIGPVEIPNRIVMPPMTTRTSDAEGFVTDELGRLLHGAGARRRRPDHRRNGVAGKMRPAPAARSRHL